MTIGQRIKKLREERGMTQEELAKVLGYSHKTSISKIESDERNLTQPKIKAIAEIFDVSPSALLGIGEENKSPEKTIDLHNYEIYPIEIKKYPLLGEIACGVPKFVNEDRESYVVAGINIRADFCLKARGDSMINARIYDGDFVFIRSQSQVDNGEIAAVIINDETTLKRVFYYPEKNTLILKAENPKYKDYIFGGEELNNIHILGKAVAFQSDVL